VNATERRIRELQRTAYGADADDAERAAALVELADLVKSPAPDAAAAPMAAGSDTRGSTGRPTRPDAPPDDLSDGRTGPTAPPGTTGATGATGSVAAPVANAGEAATRRRLVRSVAVAACLGVLVGGVLGWSTAQRVPSTSSSSSRFGVVSTPEPGVPLEDTRIPELFDRLPTAVDAARIAGIDDSVDVASVRLLATRTDGPSAFLVRTLDGGDICLVLAFPAGPFQRECTSDGIFPIDGLSVQYGLDRYGLAVARLTSAGTVSLGLIVS
jgi:hypothetical protein